MSRPTIFKESYCEEVIELMGKGFSDVAICAYWGISRDTYYRWIKEKPEFKEAVEIGQPKYQDLMEQIGFKGMMGEIRGFSSGMWQTLMKAKCKDDYREDRKDSQVIQAQNVNILNTFAEMSTDKLIENIQTKLIKNRIIDNESRELIPSRTIGTSEQSAEPGNTEEI